jgi:hypothetical protein
MGIKMYRAIFSIIYFVCAAVAFYLEPKSEIPLYFLILSNIWMQKDL